MIARQSTTYAVQVPCKFVADVPTKERRVQLNTMQFLCKNSLYRAQSDDATIRAAALNCICGYDRDDVEPFLGSFAQLLASRKFTNGEWLRLVGFIVDKFNVDFNVLPEAEDVRFHLGGFEVKLPEERRGKAFELIFANEAVMTIMLTSASEAVLIELDALAYELMETSADPAAAAGAASFLEMRFAPGSGAVFASAQDDFNQAKFQPGQLDSVSDK